MPIPSTIEARRIAVTDALEQVVPFNIGHSKVPVVSITLEPGGFSDYTTARVTSVTKTSATIQFSSRFSGYLHLHAFSVA